MCRVNHVRCLRFICNPGTRFIPIILQWVIVAKQTYCFYVYLHDLLSTFYYQRMFNKNNMTGATSEAGIAYS